MGRVLYIILPLAGFALGWLIRWLYAKFQLTATENKAEQIRREAKKEAESIKKELLLEAKEKLISERNQQEKETRERRAEIQRYEHRVAQKEDAVEKKTKQMERLEQQLVEKDKALADRTALLAKKESEIAHEEERYRKELVRISGLSVEEAKALIIRDLENEARHDAQTILNKIESETNLAGEKKARDIIIAAIQRIGRDVTSETTVSAVSLPNDEMKGHIIGREGRNIRSFETVTGADIIIDDTPEAVVISCFDPVRREIAKIALERLIADGRIHPARIEEVVSRVSKEISQRVFEEGEKVLYTLGIHNISNDAIRSLGRLHFRTSYGQNVLSHSKEVAQIASLLAAELGANREIAKRAALLHDIGKGADTDSDLNHAEIGMDMARKMGEDPRIINAIGSHHDDIPPSCLESIIVQIADALSAARPGARKETMDAYVKRLKNLEDIANAFTGVDKSFAIQAGRELRILVRSEEVNDDQATNLSRNVARKIENDLRYPGRIKVTVIRETRIVEYAR
ncbi:MAG: ribonuclease Y, partial [Spirochaetaceae bacterium]|jgi:ribonuclease Y|nr:ribonuclease Y [Spirochaetaceae bacterium]